MKYLLSLLILTFSSFLYSQNCYWQQNADYVMDIDMNTENHRFTGYQKATYTNNSPDTLTSFYYHLYFNAFQPGSMMDVRSRTIADPDRRVQDRIEKLNEDEIGYHRIDSLLRDGVPLKHKTDGTILIVQLDKPILPGETTVFTMKFNSQVPVQIRRSGRNNIEGIDYSMSQWYPKIAEYDVEGWHAIPYVAREFHGVWGNFEVNITIDSTYLLAGTGELTNHHDIGKGYGKKENFSDSDKLTWKFKADNVHDFVWAADPDYIHTTANVNNGTILHFFYQNDTSILENWENMVPYAVRTFELMNDMVGEYPYPVYNIIQGGDGGMEYPMATLIMGNGSFGGLVSVMVHESIHSWFQGVLANDEGNYPWLDEGYNTYYNHLVKDSLFNKNAKYPHLGSYKSYYKLLASGNYEAISLHSDHYRTNQAYGVAAYSMGCVFLNQLQYVIGSEKFERTMKRYYNTWKFKHPTPTDFKRIAEKESGIELDWYFNYFLHTSKVVEYGITGVEKSKKETIINLERNGEFPMPVDLEVELKDGSIHQYNIPLRMMLESKKNDLEFAFEVQETWPWTHPTYQLIVPFKEKDIVRIQIDPTLRLADVSSKNNIYPFPEAEDEDTKGK